MSKTPKRVCFTSAVVTPLEFQNALKAREQAKLGKLKVAPLPLTDEAIRARIAALEVENRRLRSAKRNREANAQAVAINTQAAREKQATASAEQLMRQMLGNRKANKN